MYFSMRDLSKTCPVLEMTGCWGVEPETEHENDGGSTACARGTEGARALPRAREPTEGWTDLSRRT